MKIILDTLFRFWSTGTSMNKHMKNPIGRFLSVLMLAMLMAFMVQTANAVPSAPQTTQLAAPDIGPSFDSLSFTADAAIFAVSLGDFVLTDVTNYAADKPVFAATATQPTLAIKPERPERQWRHRRQLSGVTMRSSIRLTKFGDYCRG